MIKYIKKTFNSPLMRAVLLATISIITIYFLTIINTLEFKSPFLNDIMEKIQFLIRLNALWLILLIIWEKSNPARTVAWMAIIIFQPALGFALYMVFGKNFSKRKKAAKKFVSSTYHFSLGAKRQLEETKNSGLKKLLIESADAPIYRENLVEIVTNGGDKYTKLFEFIKNAKKHIHLEYYIIRDDNVGETLSNLLQKKAQEGVEVRIIYDDVGSLMLSKSYKNKLRQSGVEIKPFFKVGMPVFSRNLNYRTHRKMVIIDGRVGFIGGFNIGDEYLGKSKKLGEWSDLHLIIDGKSVQYLQSVFLDDWNFVAKQNIEGEKYFPEFCLETSDHRYSNELQVVASGPDHKFTSMHRAFIKFISMAKDRLWITTPYLVPTQTIKNCLKVAALSGVDVRIVIPEKKDHFFVYWAGQSCIEELLASGVKIYKYIPGFLHSKMMICDDEAVTVGTANLDARSMEINFEINTFIYEKKLILELQKKYLEVEYRSKAYNIDKFRKRSVFRKLLEAFASLFAPLQ